MCLSFMHICSCDVIGSTAGFTGDMHMSPVKPISLLHQDHSEPAQQDDESEEITLDDAKEDIAFRSQQILVFHFVC